MSLAEKFRSYVTHEGLFTHDDRVLLAVSGGVDSMVLLSLVHGAGYRCAVAHCNFHLRGEESDGDELFVRSEVQKLGVTYHSVHFDTYAEVASTGESVEMAARRLRYTWFDELCRSHGYSVVVIAHHLDDSIETHFINMLRGTGVRGIAGIAPRNGRIVRPLLFATREEIVAYAKQYDIPFREDSSNRSMKHLRNRVRHELVPMLKQMNPQFTPVMQRNMALFSQSQSFIDASIELIKSRVLSKIGDTYRLDVTLIDSSLPRDFVIYEVLNSEFGFRREVVSRLCAALDSGNTGRRFFSFDMVAVIDRGAILIEPIAEHDDTRIEILSDEISASMGDIVFNFESINIDDVKTLNQGADIALLDAEKLCFPLVIRRWHEGDSMVPLGMTGRKKISDMLIDSKVPLLDKREEYVVVSGDDIVWLVGRRIDNRYAINSDTSRVLRISVVH